MADPCIVSGILKDAAGNLLTSTKITFQRLGTMEAIEGETVVVPVFGTSAARVDPVITDATTAAFSVTLLPGMARCSYQGPTGIESIDFPVPLAATADFAVQIAQATNIVESTVVQQVFAARDLAQAKADAAAAYVDLTTGAAWHTFSGGGNSAVTLPVNPANIRIEANGTFIDPANYAFTAGTNTVTPSGGYYWPTGTDNCTVWMFSAISAGTVAPIIDEITAEVAAMRDEVAADLVQTGLDADEAEGHKNLAYGYALATAADRVATGEDAVATAADRVATAADRVATGLDVAATSADRVATGADAAATAADRAQTGLDVLATAADRVATGADAVATAADRVQTGADVDEAGAHKDLAYGYAQDAASAVVYQNLASLAASKTETAVDVFVYDTSRDSDGGAWRGWCQSKSWYTETLNTATRGARRAFPAVAVIVATASVVTIYDGDDPALPMWRVQTPGQTITSLAARNGKIALGTTTGVVVLDYAADAISGALTYTTATSPAIVNASVNDVAITVLPDAPTAPETGLPVPTMAVATNGGLSVVKDDGTVVDLPTSGIASSWAGFNDRHQLASCGNYGDRWVLREIPTADLANLEIGDATFITKPYRQYGQSADYQRQISFGDTYASDLGGTKNGLLLEYGAGAALGSTSLLALITSTYNTGWMPGDIKGAWLASKNTASLVGGTDSDRSVNGTALTVTGTITRTAVAAGAELVGYGGFSASNYLSATNAAFADTLYALGWVQTAGVWEFAHGVVSAAPIDGLTITGTTLKIEGTKPKALIRLTATVPSADQLAKIYAAEAPLFQTGAACTLYGASDLVTALAHDPATGLLHVGTSGGRSTFSGLRRVANTTTPVTTAIAAAGDLIAEQ